MAVFTRLGIPNWGWGEGAPQRRSPRYLGMLWCSKQDVADNEQNLGDLIWQGVSWFPGRQAHWKKKKWWLQPLGPFGAGGGRGEGSEKGRLLHSRQGFLWVSFVVSRLSLAISILLGTSVWPGALVSPLPTGITSHVPGSSSYRTTMR